MKSLVKYIAVVGVMALGLTSCVKDLDVTPQASDKIMTFDQGAMFTKLYATLSLTGQQGPAGNGDVEGIDEGTSDFYRMIWELQEFPTDEGWCNWNDPGLPDLRAIRWTSSNSLVAGIYYRFYINIALCNHFLAEASSDGEGEQQIAEARLLRALNYYYLLDMFGGVPFTLKVNAEQKPQYSRTELFEWLEEELKDLENVLPAKRANDYRCDRVAAQMLLARMYLNAQVYTGTARWSDASTYAKKVMDSQYKLHTTSLGGVYTPYQELFMGDNYRVLGGDGGEGIFIIYKDGVMAQSWGGSTFLVAAFRDKTGYMGTGSSEGWTGFRASPEFLLRWIDKLDDAPAIKENEFDMPTKLGDDRAILCDKLTIEKTFGDTLTGMPLGNMGDFYDNWSVLKWTGRYIDNPLGDDITISPHHSQFPDTDIPLMRVGEAYMTYAEAQFRLGNTGEAKNTIQALRDRAHNTKSFEVTEQFLLDEWSREMYAEAHRRTDLVRFGKFAGPSADYHWEGRGGVASDGAIANLPAKYNVFPLPEADVVVGGYTQTEGY